MADTADVGVFQLRRRPSSQGAAVSLRQLLDRGRELDLAGVLLLYDRGLSVLDALHRSGRVHGAVSADTIGIGADGAVTLEQPGAAPPGEDQPLVFEMQGATGAATAQDVRALTEVMVDALPCGAAAARIPLPARELVRRGLGEDAPLAAPAGDLRADTAEAGHAFFGDGWREAGAVALATAVRDLRGGTPPSGGPRRRAPARLAGAAIGAALLLAAPVLVGRALASDQSVSGQAGEAGVSSAIRTAPSAALVSPATAGPGTGAPAITVPSASPAPHTSSTQRRATAASTPAVTPRRGATSELTPSPRSSPTATATSAPAATSTASPAPTPTAIPTPTPTATPIPTATPTLTPKPTPTATAKPTPTAAPKATPTATPKPTP